MTAPTAIDITIELQCGAWWWMQCTNTDSAENPVAITTPKMEIRAGADSDSDLLYTTEGGSPTITVSQPATNQVLFEIAGAVTANLTEVQDGYWDAYATDQSGNRVLLGKGTFLTVLNVTEL